jgi:protein involved in polysaccharide export with SLBB domain
MQIGTGLGQFRQTQGGFFDYSDPTSVNIKVSVWGFVKFPGRYIIPVYSNLNDLLSLAGGPTEDSYLDKLKILRMAPDSSQQVMDIKYKDVLWGEDLKSVERPAKIMAGDVLIVPGEPRLYFKDYLSISISVFSVLISLSILILNIVK